LGNVKASKAMRLEQDGGKDAARSLRGESYQLHKDTLEQYQSTLGQFNHRTADACHKLAEYHIWNGDDELAQ
jgi:hypothetical protein